MKICSNYNKIFILLNYFLKVLQIFNKDHSNIIINKINNKLILLNRINLLININLLTNFI